MNNGQEPELPLYLGNVLNSFENGVQLDLRVKLAKDFLCSPNAVPPEVLEDLERQRRSPVGRAEYALDLATALLAEASRRGLVKPIPEHDELPPPLVRHITRSVRAGVLQALAGQRIGREESSPNIMQGLPRA